MKFKAKKSISVIVVAVLALAVGLGVLSVSHNAKSKKQFVADGFILDAPAEVAVTEVNQQYYFSQGAKYQEKFDTKVLFKDANGEDVSIDINQFLHYADGSLGAFTKGVIMNLDDVGKEQFGYYSVTPNTLLIKNGTNYEMSSRGEAMSISEFVWKISDTDYMIVSPEVTLKMSASQEITLPNYAQIKYVDSGIVRIIHQQGTYQTVSADSFLYTENGAELNLVGKNFYQNGEPGLSLDSMAIDDEDYIELDENADSPELKIPTFNVINGKDGAAGNTGAAGETGEIGEDGEDGEEGKEGTEGEEGVAGEEGAAGAQGNQGEDGVEGDEGIMGYDGAEGKEGEDAQNGDDPIVAVDLFTRPTVSVDTANGYEVTSGSAQMQFDLFDMDQSLVGNGTTSVEVYDRATMERVNSASDAANLGAQLEQTGKLNFTQTGLNPDTEYVVVVKGQYMVAEGVPVMDATLYSKIFKTDALGIILSKDVVTEDSVSAKSEVTATNVKSYMVHFYTYDEDGNKVSLAYFDGLTGTTTSVFDNNNPTFDSGNRPAGETYKLASNTSYYAEIANVMDTNDQMVSAGDTEIELKTLKKKPYHKGTDENGAEEITSVTAMLPVVTTNNKARTITVSLDRVEDDDNGITGYRYELYRKADFDDAVTDGTIANLQPAFTKSVEAAADQTFSVPEGDNSEYIARVVVEFNDNEKDVEYSTLFTDVVSLSASASDLLVEFADIATYPEAIEGRIKITDATGVVQSHISATNPLVLTILGEYDDVKTIKITDPSMATVNGNTYLYDFEQIGLHKNATYTLSLSGPWDTDGDGNIGDAESKTFLAGARATTTETYAVSMAFRTVNNMATVAFAQSFYLTSPEQTGAEGEQEVSFYQYEANIMNKLEFELIHVLDNGVEQKMGNNATVMDVQYEDLTHDSIFYRSCWVERNDTNIVAASDGGIKVTDAVPSNNLVLTPASFGLDNNDSRFFSGGKFKIRAVVGKDYTTHENEIPFVNGEDIVVFEITKRHVQATDPNTQVSASVITNSGAREGFGEAGKGDDTIVGVRFRAEYPYTDAVRAKYYIYKLEDTDPASDTFRGQLFYEDTKPGSLVLVGEQTIGASGQYHTSEIELYFDGTKSYNANNTTITWTDKDGNNAVGQTILERGNRYYIRYEVEADKAMIDCGNDSTNDIYPKCAYNQGDSIPYYRSSIIEFEKQTPKVLRYPYTSDANSATWMYYVIDPDGAVESGFMIKKGNTADAAKGATASSLTTDVSGGYLNDYTALQVTGLSDGNYYAVALNYKLSSTAQTQSITSAPVLFKSAISSAPAGIKAQGVGATDNTPTENINAAGHEKAIINEGGYRYKLTLQGTDIKKYAAYKVTFTDKDGSGNKVVFDPVYPDYIGSTSSGDYATLYMDASPVKALVLQNVSEVTVTVDGYYDTYVNGVDGYVSNAIGDTSLGDENLFALKMYQEDGSTSYRKLYNNAWISVTDSVSGSVIIPGHDDGESGFALESDKESATITMRYATTPLSVSTTGIAGFSDNLVLNETGMRVTAMANTAYYTVEKLGKKENISFTTAADQTLTIGDILPAVEKVEITPGATSAYLRFKTLGTGATEDSKIYAKVYDGTGKLYTVTQETEGEEGEEITYYQLGAEGSDDDYAQSSFKDNAIPLYTNNGNIYAELRIRGLITNKDYKVVLFAYNAGGDIVNLYSFDGNRTGYEYAFKTLSNIDITVVGPSYTYTKYADKKATFNFGIPGDEGTNKLISYEVFEGSKDNNIKVASGDVAPLESGSYKYYSQSPSQNNPIVVGMNPASGLRLNTTYTIVVTAKASVGDDVLGTKEVTFTTPESLKDPTFNITATSRKQDDVSNLVTVSATIASTDAQRAIINDTYKVELIDKEAGTMVSEQTVTRSASTSHAKTVSFVDITGGKEYIIKVTAEVDNANNGSVSKTIEQEYTVTALGNTTAQIGTAANLSQLYVTFTNWQGFDLVSKIIITVNNPSDGSQIMSNTFEVTEEMKNEGTIEYISNWTVPEAGNYMLTVQYRDSQNVALGNNTATVIVQDTGADVSDGAGIEQQSSFRLMSLRRQPEAGEDEEEIKDDEVTTSEGGSGDTTSSDTTSSDTTSSDTTSSDTTSSDTTSSDATSGDTTSSDTTNNSTTNGSNTTESNESGNAGNSTDSTNTGNGDGDNAGNSTGSTDAGSSGSDSTDGSTGSTDTGNSEGDSAGGSTGAESSDGDSGSGNDTITE